MIVEAFRRAGIEYTLKPKDGTFYAPKIDIQVEDALGRSWQTATIQVDLTMLPERFDLSYIDEHGHPQRPMAIHRAIYGTIERFTGFLIEHFAGAFPLWLSPEQVRVLPIADGQTDAAREFLVDLQRLDRDSVVGSEVPRVGQDPHAGRRGRVRLAALVCLEHLCRSEASLVPTANSVWPKATTC